MSDLADIANRTAAIYLDSDMNKAKIAAAAIEPGRAGDCDGCGEHFERVVYRGSGDFCGGCRDKFKLG